MNDRDLKIISKMRGYCKDINCEEYIDGGYPQAGM